MLATIALALTQQPGFQVHPDDPLHRWIVLEVEAGEAVVELETDFTGALDVWVRSDAVAPDLRVDVPDLDGWMQSNPTSGTAVGLPIGAQPGRALKVIVRWASEPPAEVELHLVESPETATTRDATRSAFATLEELARASEGGALPETREQIAVLIEELLATEGAETSAQVANALWEAGFLAYRLSAPRTTLPAWTACVRYLERVRSPENPDLLQGQLNLAAVRGALGDLDGALALLEVVHATWEQRLPADHPNLLSAKQNLAAARKELGDLAGALELEEYVLAARERTLPPDDPAVLDALQNLALTRQHLRDLDGALELGERAHAAWERILAPDDHDLLLAKMNLAATRKDLGDLRGALELFEHVYAAWERLLPPDHPDLLAAAQNVAFTRALLGDLAGAEALGELVHAAWERLLPADHPDLLAAKLNLALTRRALGDLDGALELDEHVHAARERILPPSHPDLLLAKETVARTRKERGDLDGALSMTRSLLAGQLARVAELRAESPRVARAAALEELGRLSTVLHCIDGAKPGSPGSSGLDVLLFSVLESLRLVSTSSSEVALAVTRFPELGELHARLGDLRGELNDLGVSPPTGVPELEAWRSELFRIADERDRLERELRSALQARDVFTDAPTGEGVANGLAADAVLVSFFRYTRLRGGDADLSASSRASLQADAALLAFVVTPDARVRRVELGPCARLEELASRWLDHLRDPGLDPRGIAVGEPAEAGSGQPDEVEPGRALRALLVDPCLAALDRPGSDRPATLHVVADDFLHLLPLDALPWTDERRLGDVLAVRAEVSVQRLVSPARATAGSGTLVALGGVDYGAQGIEAPAAPIRIAVPPTRGLPDRRGSRSFADLPQTRAEVETLARLHEELLGGEPVVLVEEQASKRRLIELAPRARFLHVATHGWFAPETFESMIDGAEGADDFAAGRSRAEETVRGFVPETLCGIALAGASSGRNERGEVPGILTAEELATLDLASCELAVLSACETNVGIRRAGQGIQSLQAALHTAGARSSITSLWKVDDAATRRLMELFYTELWENRKPKAEALWEAKRVLREEGAPVRDWAGWVLSGDPN